MSDFLSIDPSSFRPFLYAVNENGNRPDKFSVAGYVCKLVKSIHWGLLRSCREFSSRDFEVMSVSNGFLPSEDSSTVFTELKETFPQYDTEKIKTMELIEGSQGVVKVIERFGKVFAPVVFDMNRNIDKINAKYKDDEQNFEYVEDMILAEKQNDGIVVTDALQWLRRALHFISRLFHHILDNHDNGSITSDLTPMLKRAYSETLEPYHGWLGTQLFNVMSRFAPTIHCLYYTLALDKHNKVEHVIRDMRILTEKIDGCVEKLRKFYEDNNLETHYRA